MHDAKRFGAPVSPLALTPSCTSSKSAKDVKMADPGGARAPADLLHSSKGGPAIHVSSRIASVDSASPVDRQSARWDSKGTVSAKGPLRCSLDC
jgi:hypothetical protein